MDLTLRLQRGRRSGSCPLVLNWALLLIICFRRREKPWGGILSAEWRGTESETVRMGCGFTLLILKAWQVRRMSYISGRRARNHLNSSQGLKEERLMWTGRALWPEYSEPLHRSVCCLRNTLSVRWNESWLWLLGVPLGSKKWVSGKAWRCLWKREVEGWQALMINMHINDCLFWKCL